MTGKNTFLFDIAKIIAQKFGFRPCQYELGFKQFS